MCKIMIIPKVKNSAKIKQFMKAAAPYMSADDPHGLGYAALTDKGTIIAERWLNPKQAFKPLKSVVAGSESRALQPIAHCLDGAASVGYNKVGDDFESPLKAVIYHTRMATCEVNLTNVHPFISGTTALIHNGVISNPEHFKPTQSTCDSEAILNGYNEFNVPDSMLGVADLSDTLRGWFACGAISRNSKGQWNVDVFKDDSTNLVAMFINELDTIVYCTKASILTKACKDLKWSHGEAYAVLPSTMIRYDGMTGEVVDAFQYDTAPNSSFTDRFDNGFYEELDGEFTWKGDDLVRRMK
jgi:hypothetical protein